MTTSDPWRDHELDLRIKEVGAAVQASDAAVSSASLQRRTTILQVIAVFAGLLASGAAAFAALQAGAAVRAAERGTTQQSADNQLSTAISAIGGNTPAEQVAGMTLLDLNVHSRISSASSGLDKQKAYGEYVTAVDVLANYIRSASTPAPAGAISTSSQPTFGPGYGYPSAGQGTPFDVAYAADELRDLLRLKDKVDELGVKPNVGVDLSHDELFGISLAGVRFGWIDAYMLKIDLRGSNLSNANFSHANLAGAYLQCADLSGVNFTGANLNDADLRGANVNGATFSGATMKHTRLTQTFGTAKGLPPGLPETTWNQDPTGCETNQHYWHQPPG